MSNMRGMRRRTRKRIEKFTPWAPMTASAVLIMVLAIAAYVALKPGPVAQAGQTLTGGPTAAAAAKPSKSGPQPVAVFFGDSYTSGAGASTPAKRWTSIVAADEGWREVNEGFGGTGYATASTGTNAYAYDNSVRVGRVALDKPSIVIVSGGRNDIDVPPATEAAAITATFQALRAKLPKAEIIAISPFGIGQPVARPAFLDVIGAEVKAAVLAVGGQYEDVPDTLGGDTLFIHPDGVNAHHPTDLGYQKLAIAIAQAMPKV